MRAIVLLSSIGVLIAGGIEPFAASAAPVNSADQPQLVRSYRCRSEHDTEELTYLEVRSPAVLTLPTELEGQEYRSILFEIWQAPVSDRQWEKVHNAVVDKKMFPSSNEWKEFWKSHKRSFQEDGPAAAPATDTILLPALNSGGI